MGVIKDKILEVLHAVPGDAVKNPDRKSNTGKVLFELFFWQEVQKEADSQLKKLWEEAATAELLRDDDEYRKKLGESIAAESDSFSCLMKVSKGRNTIDKDAFLAAVAKKARISVESLEELWDNNQKESKPSLSKRILEV